MMNFTLVGFLLFILSPALSGAQSFYHLNPQGLSPEQVPAIQNFLSQAENKLPNKLRVQFPAGISVEFSLNNKAHGKAFTKSKEPRMALNTKLISAITAGEERSEPSLDEKGNLRIHKTVYREAMATVFHETAHLYDFLNIQTYEMKQWIGFCSFISPDDQRQQEDCAIYKDIKTTLSTNPYYLEVAGWVLASNGNGSRTSDSVFKYRTPDPYELENPQEHFAVNFEYFLLDPNYACKRPTLARFFAQHFSVAAPECATPLKYVDPDATDLDPKTKTIRNLFKEIPLDRLYQVHYLLAEPGHEMMSRWGHSMLRLVICAPGQPKGPKCLTEGIPYNLVLSFRAFIDAPQINSIAGLTGRYPSRLFVLPLDSVIREYNEMEYRGLKSYPLNLTEAEMKNLVLRALETHWSYDNRYYFISNNCAVETLNLLRASLLKKELIDKRVIFPKDLLSVLLQEKVARPIPKDPKAALEQGYYFDSNELKHLQSYNLFFGRNADRGELRDFLKQPIEKRREAYFARFEELPKPLSYKNIVSPYQLERYKLGLKRSEFYSKVTAKIWLNQKGQQVSEITNMSLTDIFKKGLEAFGALSAPYQILKLNDYGVPDEKEIQDSETELTVIQNEIQEARKMKDKVSSEMENDPDFQEIEKGKKLINDILDAK